MRIYPHPCRQDQNLLRKNSPLSPRNQTDAATNVAINASVSATFSLLINGSTLTTDSFKVSKDGEELAGSVTTNAKTATFTPSENFDYNTTYTARVTTKAQAANWAGTTLDNDYTWSFTTTEDADPPTVSSTSPANGAASVAINSAITATFSEAMQSSTINTDTFTVSDGSNTISGTISYNDTTTTFTPSGSLSNSTTYTARITTEARDSAGNTMASDYTWSFTTVDTTLPTVSSTSPANGATGVAINSVITATFSEAMLSSAMNTDTFTVSDGNGIIGGTVSYSDKPQPLHRQTACLIQPPIRQGLPRGRWIWLVIRWRPIIPGALRLLILPGRRSVSQLLPMEILAWQSTARLLPRSARRCSLLLLIRIHSR